MLSTIEPSNRIPITMSTMRIQNRPVSSMRGVSAVGGGVVVVATGLVGEGVTS
jgi:hypothetical protein